MALYDSLFGLMDCQAAQVLVTSNDFADADFRKNLSATTEDLLSMNVVPVFNENDAISSRTTAEVVSSSFCVHKRISTSELAAFTAFTCVEILCHAANCTDSNLLSLALPHLYCLALELVRLALLLQHCCIWQAAASVKTCWTTTHFCE